MMPARAQATPTAEKAGGLHAISRGSSAAEHEAARFADHFATTGQGPSWSYRSLPVHPTHSGGDEPAREGALDVRLAGEGSPLEDSLVHPLGIALGADLSDVRVHVDSSASDTARRAGANAVTAGRDIAFAPGMYAPDSAEGRRRIAHEAAHVAQQSRSAKTAVAHRDGKGAVSPATTLAGLPEADRKRIQVVSTTTLTAPTADELKDKYFDKGTTLGGPADTTIAMDTSVPAALHRGLTNLAGDWSTGADPALAPNTTLTVEIDLTKQGGSKAPIRFTYNQPPAAKGKNLEGRIVVEQMGATTPPAGTTKPKPAKPGDPAPPDPIADKLKAASITASGYSADEEETLRAAISVVPASHLVTLSGLRFGRKGKDDKDPKVAGRYFPKENKIVMYDNAFSASDVKFVEGGTATSYATRLIVHEIGHAVDLRPLAKAYEAKESATKAVNAASGEFRNADEKKKYDDAVKAETTATKTLKDLTTSSGTKTVEKKPPKGEKVDPAAPKDYEDVISATDAGIAYRAAVRKDGKVDVSKYAEDDWQENYAEAYSLFVTAPTTLKSLRPNTYDWFVKNLPK